MKLNKKGITLVELIVSIALISVVMLFMYKLLADITFEKENDFFASLNQEQRVEIIDKIESLIGDNLTKNATTIDDYNIRIVASDNSLLYKVSIENNNKELAVYDAHDNVIYRWQIKGGTLGKAMCQSKSYSADILTECVIPIYTSNIDNKKLDSIDNNNTVDDIIFSFIYKG